MTRTLRISLGAVAGLILSASSYAASCNPNAQVHQQRLANIMQSLQFGGIPTADDEQFVHCMLSEKEDKQAFDQRVQQLKNERQAQQRQQELERQQAIARHNSPASAQEQAQAQWNCEYTVQEGGELRNAGMAYCLAAWRANPHSRCAAGNLPCGSDNEGLCYNPYASQRCVNGQVTGTLPNVPTSSNGWAVSPWVEAAPIQATTLADGVYTDVAKPCASPGRPGVILIQGTSARIGRDTYTLSNTKQQGVLDAINNGTGDNGYNGQVIISGSIISWSGFGVDAPRPFRLCQGLGTQRAAANQGAVTARQSPTSNCGRVLANHEVIFRDDVPGASCQGNCAVAEMAKLQAYRLTIREINRNIGSAPYMHACVGFRTDLGGTAEGAQCLLDMLGAPYKLSEPRFSVAPTLFCQADGWPYIVGIK